MVDLFQANFSTDTFTLLASQVLTAAQLAGNTQIELDLAHNTVNTSAITGSFELIENGSQTFTERSQRPRMPSTTKPTPAQSCLPLPLRR